MTAVLAVPAVPAESWTTPAGWGIYADLTPPELASGRRLKRIRRLMVFALAALVVLIVLAFAYARFMSARAASDVAAQQSRTSQLQAQQQSYSSVTALQGSIAQVRGSLATLMVGDVDVAHLLGTVQAALPPSMTVNQESVTVSGAAAAAAGASGTSLDTSGKTQVGKITVGGTAPDLLALASYVGNLQMVPGVVDVVPTSSQLTKGVVTFTVTMSVTDAVLSHRYDVTPRPASR